MVESCQMLLHNKFEKLWHNSVNKILNLSLSTQCGFEAHFSSEESVKLKKNFQY